MTILEKKVKGIVQEYNNYAMDILLPTALTVMLWMSMQSLIAEGVKQYLPSMATWQLATVEVFAASFGLYFVAKNKNKEVVECEQKNVSTAAPP